MKVVVTFDVDEKNLDDFVVMAKVYRKKYGYKEFVSVENNLPLKPLPQKVEMDFNEYYEGMADGWNACIDEIIGDNDDEV